MNPLRWVRWKVVAVLAVIFGAAYSLGLDKVALSEINTAGKESKAARWAVSDLAMGLIQGNASLRNLLLSTPKAGEKDQVFNADAAKLDLSMSDILARRYYVDQVAMEGPKLNVQRREDGSINIEDLGGEKPPEEPSAPGKSPQDWYETLKKWYERLQKARERIPERKKAPREPGFKADYSRGAEYPLEGRPSYAVHEIVGSNFEVHFEDAASKAKIPPLEKGTIKITEVTSSPSVQNAPTGFSLSGVIAGSKLEVNGSLDLRGGKTALDLNGDTGDLPVSLVEAFVGASLPVSLKTGTVRVAFTKLALGGVEKLEVAPLLSFKGLTLEPKDPRGKIAGVDANQFATAFNEAMKEMPELTIDDLKITGSIRSPSFEWGDTVKNLVVSGGKAFAKKQLGKGLEKGKDLLQKEIDKVPAGAELKEKLKDVKVDNVQKGLEDAARSIFGGSKEKK